MLEERLVVLQRDIVKTKDACKDQHEQLEKVKGYHRAFLREIQVREAARAQRRRDRMDAEMRRERDRRREDERERMRRLERERERRGAQGRVRR